MQAPDYLAKSAIMQLPTTIRRDQLRSDRNAWRARLMVCGDTGKKRLLSFSQALTFLYRSFSGTPFPGPSFPQIARSASFTAARMWPCVTIGLGFDWDSAATAAGVRNVA